VTRPLRIGEAIDLFLGDLARQGRRDGTLRDYRYKLNLLADDLKDCYVDEIEVTGYERFLNRWVGAAPSTLASSVSLVHVFSKFLWRRGFAREDVGRMIERPRKPRPEDLDVVTVSTEDVRRMMDACESWQEFLCLSTAIYLGARRGALARVRLSDVDFDAGTIRFFEKGGKVIVKPLPEEYVEILRAAQEEGIWKRPEDYLIPNRRPGAVRNPERSDKVIWETVRKVARRAGVVCTVHALRAAFAVQFDEENPDQLIALKDLMGHERLETTLVYLRRKNRARAMEAVRTLSWGGAAQFRFPPREEAARKKPPLSRGFAEEAHTGFEPVPPP
jgi:integrase